MSLKGCAPWISIAIAAAAATFAAPADAQNLNPGADVGGTVMGSLIRPSLAQGSSLTYGVDAGIGETDNVTLVSNDKVSQSMALADADFDFKEQSRRLDVDAKGDFTYLDFLQKAYRDELLGRFDGTAELALIPERVSWALQDDFGQAQIDPFQPVTPANQENVNYVSTGPDLAMRFGPTFFVNASARYARTTYETSPFDSNRVLGNGALGLALSAQSSVSINGSFTRALFDNTVVNTDFDRSSAYGHYELQGARTDLTVNLGATKVEQGSQTITGPLAKLQLSRVLSSASQLVFTAERDVTDTSAGFANLQGGAIGIVGTAPAAVTLTNYTVTYASVGWQYARNRTTVGVSGNWEKDAYDAVPLQDLTRATAQFRIDRKLNRAFSAQLLASVYKTNYQNTDFGETDWMAGAALTFRHGRGLEIKLRIDHMSRDATGYGTLTGTGTVGDTGTAGGFAENRAFLTIGYRPRPDQGA